jgi:hypothetical protein
MGHGVFLERGAALVLVVLGGYVVVINWGCLIETRRTGRFHSAVPLVGPLLIGAGLLLLPLARPWAGTPLLADWGTLVLLFAAPRLVREGWETSRFTLVAEYRGGRDLPGERGTITVCLRLHRGGACAVEYNRTRPTAQTGMPSWSSMSLIGTWVRVGPLLTLRIGNTPTRFEIVPADGGESLRQVSGFSWEGAEELSLAGAGLRRQKGPGRA